MNNEIPVMIHEMGHHWRQPYTCNIVVTDTTATMFLADFRRLMEYSSSQPSGVYPGKMWKRQEGEYWYLCWYGEVPNRTDLCSMNYRMILIQEMIDLITPKQPA